MTEINEIIEALEKFRDDRSWQKVHNTKDLALALSIEAAELNELFLWKTVEESETADHEKLREELAGVFAKPAMLLQKRVTLMLSFLLNVPNEPYPGRAHLG